MKVEVVYAMPDRAWSVMLELPSSASVGDAVELALAQKEFATLTDELDLAGYGIWGRQVGKDARLQEGDRVELLRPLEADPMSQRRARAERSRD